MYETYGLFQRLMKLEEEFHDANMILHQLLYPPDVRKMFVLHGKSLFAQHASNVKTKFLNMLSIVVLMKDNDSAQ